MKDRAAAKNSERFSGADTESVRSYTSNNRERGDILHAVLNSAILIWELPRSGAERCNKKRLSML